MTPTRRHAYTLIEIVIASVIGLMILGAMLSIFWATRKMTGAGELSAALAEASMAMEHIHRDLLQAVQKPDPAIDKVVLVSREAAQFIRGQRRADGVLTGQLVVYRRAPTAGGHFRLVRRVGGDESALPGTYSAVGFSTFKGTGGPFVRVTLHVVARDATTPAAKGSDEAILSSLVRVAGPEMLGAKCFRWPFLDELGSVDYLKGSLGF